MLRDPRLGEALRTHDRRLPARTCTRPTWPRALTAGLAHEELAPVGGLVYRFMDRHDFVIDPLPNLLFTRDSSVWIRDRVAVTSLAMPARDARDAP